MAYVNSARRDGINEQNQTQSYSAQVMLCGDSVDPRGTRFSEVFEIIIAASRNTSEMCKCSILRHYVA